MLNLKNIIDLTIPQYLIITIFSPIAAWLILVGSQINISLILCIASLSFAMMGFNVLNMIFDKNLDKINKPSRPIPSGKVSVAEATTLLIGFYVISLSISFFINARFFLVLLAFIIVSFLYTNPITYIRKYFWSSSVIGAIIYGIIPFMAAWSVSGKDMPVIFLFLFGSLIFFIAPSKDLEDVKGEKRYNIHSLPNIIGNRNTILFITYGTIFTLISMAGMSAVKMINIKFLYASMASIILFIALNKKYLNARNEVQSNIVTQSDFVSVNMMSVILIEVIYGITSIL